ncbi:MAG: LysR family transcriptional regulator substrate-binding protein, partial [Rhodobacter sp.]|nr:LysR family transcriptional regulator substrate-binding protein [Rhodobacter sp.]
PGIVARIETASSLTIERRIEDGTIDAGITYADSVPSEMVSARHLYEERYVFLAPTSLMGGRTDAISWRKAAEFPLSLLEPGMQNRRIIDRTFDEIGVRSQVISETNALTISIAMAREGACATIVPQALVEALGPLSDMSVLPLVEPELRKEICLVCAIREPRLPAIEAFRQVALEDN